MSPLSLRARLALQTGVLLGLMALLGLVFLAELRGVSRSLNSVYEDRLVPMQQLRQLAQGVRAETPALLARLAAGRQTVAEAREALTAQQREQERLWAAYRSTFLVEEEIHLIARAEPQLRYVQEAQRRLLRQLENGQGAGSDQLAQALDEATVPLVVTLGQLIDVQLMVARRAADAGRAAAERGLWQLALALSGSAALAVLLAAWVWSSHRRAQGLAEAAERRVQQFYVALSQCNQLIVRDPESAQHLYDDMCRICVETGRALLAAVIETDGRSARRTAVHGPVERLLEGVPAAWELDSAYGQISLTGQVMRSGEHLISNEAALDPRMSHWHGTVVARGAQAVAAFPLRRSGVVVGALLIFGAERGYFDPALVRLLDEMAVDLSFALDNLERERQRMQALADAEAGRDLFRRLFNASSVSAAVTTLPDTRVLEANELICRRYGMAREALIGRRLSELGVGLGEADRARYYALLAQQGRVQNLEVTVTNRAGERLHSLVSGEIIEYQGQRCVLSTSVDITELRQAQEAAQQRVAAEATNRARTELLARMSHELRTPLHAMLGLTQLLEADGRLNLPPVQAQWLQHIRHAGWHLLGLINDVLDIAGVEARSRPGEDGRRVPELPLVAGTSPAAAGRVLYIEDNEVNRLIVEQMLAAWPALQLECAPTGSAGLARAAAAPRPDLLLLDMELPDMSGLDCLARLKADPATAGLRVVALSANAVPADVAAARAAGVLDYWVKPLELQDFLAKMRALLPPDASAPVP